VPEAGLRWGGAVRLFLGAWNRDEKQNHIFLEKGRKGAYRTDSPEIVIGLRITVKKYMLAHRSPGSSLKQEKAEKGHGRLNTPMQPTKKKVPRQDTQKGDDEKGS